MSPSGRPDGQPARPGSEAHAEADQDALRRRLAAEEAGSAYWREVARQRRVDAARVQRRPIVRAAIAVDRRTGRLQAAAARRATDLRAAGARAALSIGGLRSRPRPARREAVLAEGLAALRVDETPSADRRRVLVVTLAPAPPPISDDRVELVSLATPGSEVPAPSPIARVDAAVAASDAELVCLLGPTARPLDDRWLARLADACRHPVVATVPMVIHPRRPWRAATAHDGAVRTLGADVVLDADDAPVARAIGAGLEADPTLPGEPVALATATAVLVDRSAWDDAGGLGDHSDLDAAVAALSVRLGAAGGVVRSVPAAVVADDAPVEGPAHLGLPLEPEGEAWRAVVEAEGPALVRLGRGETRRPDGEVGRRPASFALTTAVSSRKLVTRSGDWHFAGQLAGALRRAGHDVRVQTIDEVDSRASRSRDVQLVLRGLEPVRRTSGQRHVLWVISHPEALDVAECDEADLVLVASTRFAAHLRTLTDTPVEVLLQATDPTHFHPVAPDPAHRHPVSVVASSRGVARSAVADAVAAGLRPAVHGSGWEGLVDPSLVCAPYVDFDQLPAVYAAAGVVLNDHWETMRHWGFVSNRVFDVLACGTTVASDHLPEIPELFGDLVPTWTDAEDLVALVERLSTDADRTAERTRAARELVLGAHTFEHRVRELAALLLRHGLAEPPADDR